MFRKNLFHRIAAVAASLLAMFPQVLCAQIAAAPVQESTAGTTTTKSTSPAKSEAGQLIVLSPFVVSGAADTGYRATNSLAGTRINTSLRDLGAAISVVTKEFIKDSATTGMDEMLVYTTGTEVGGANGNFTNSSFERSRPGQQSNRSNPEGNTRIRGLVSAEISRDFFITDFSFDSFNTERVDISRGPNSLLFGVGSPGGVINSTVKQPSFYKDLYEFSIRIGERGSHREVLDLNEIIVPKRLAVRASFLNDRNNYRQEPAYKHDQRAYTAIEFVLREGSQQGFLGITKLNANFETAKVSTTPTNVIAPVDSIRDWYNAPDVAAIVSQSGGTAPAIYTNGTFQSQALHDVLGTNAPFLGSRAQWLPWFIAVGQVYSNPTNGSGPLVGFTNPTDASLQGFQGRITGVGAFDWEIQTNLTEEPWTSGFAARTFQDTDIYDFKNQLITGTLENRSDKFSNATVTLQQLFLGGKGGLELSFNRQSLTRHTRFPFSDFRANDIWLDNNLWLGNRQPNPNVGRPVLISRNWGDRNVSDIDRSTIRATAFYDLDLRDAFKSGIGKWFGRHVFSGIAERNTRDVTNLDYDANISSNEVNMQTVLSGLKGSSRRWSHAAFYVGPDLRSVKNYDDVHFDGYIDVPPAKHGDTFLTFIKDPSTNSVRNVTAFVDEYLNAGGARKRVLDSSAIAWQSYLFNDYIVGLVGYRHDRVRDTTSVGDGGIRLADGSFNPAALVLSSTPSLDSSGNTKTWSLVAHYPEKYLFKLPFGADISLFYAKSENFQPTNFRQSILLQSIAPPTGITEEKGFNLSLLKDRFNVRVNWFETKNDNVSLNTPLAGLATQTVVGWLNHLLEAKRLGLPLGYDVRGNSTGLANFYNSYDQAISALLGLIPEPMKSAANIRIKDEGVGLSNILVSPVPGLASASSFLAKGVEVEFVANPTRNWTIALNVASQETVRSGSGLDLQQYYSSIQQGLVAAHLWDTGVRDQPSNGATDTYRETLSRNILNPLAALVAQDGTVSREQRKWRWNLMTSYKFNENILRGFEIGGAVRWQDKAAVGYPILLRTNEGVTVQVPDLANPFFAPATWNGDIFLRYSHVLFKKIHWSVQANFRNYLGDQALTPEVINPDGQWAVVRIPVERTVFLTNTFSF